LTRSRGWKRSAEQVPEHDPAMNALATGYCTKNKNKMFRFSSVGCHRQVPKVNIAFKSPNQMDFNDIKRYEMKVTDFV